MAEILWGPSGERLEHAGSYRITPNENGRFVVQKLDIFVTRSLGLSPLALGWATVTTLATRDEALAYIKDAVAREKDSAAKLARPSEYFDKDGQPIGDPLA